MSKDCVSVMLRLLSLWYKQSNCQIECQEMHLPSMAILPLLYACNVGCLYCGVKHGLVLD